MITKDELCGFLAEIFESIRILMTRNLRNPSLVLIYSLIDILAWLNMPDEKDNVQRLDFINWSDKYLQPEKYLNCSSIDLYGARCGWVHSYNTESKLSRSKEARKIYYSLSIEDNDSLIEFNNKEGIDSNFIVLAIDVLFDRILEGAYFFLSEKGNDHIVLKRAESFLKYVPSTWIT